MEKFVKSIHYLIFPLIFLVGCASVQSSGYISRIDHPYERKYYGSFEKVVSSFMYVLKNKGWTIDSEADPSIYERDDRYENNGYQNLLIMTSVKKKSLNLTSMHLNIFIHSLGNVCNVEIRYESQTSLIKQFTNGRNDQMAKEILNDVEDDVNR